MGGIDIRDVSHHFVNGQTGETVQALHNINLQIPAGEFLVIVGPSGCGKSTLLKAIAGLVQQTDGKIICGGHEVVGPGADRGFVFQDLALMPWRTVRRNIEHGMEIQKLSRDERHERSRYLINLMGLSGFENHYPHQLSGGMKQRVAIARTWAVNPGVILMDEPFSAVDAQTKITLQQELIRMTSGRESTIVFITHDVEEAVLLGDRIVVMSRRPGEIKDVVTFDVERERRTVSLMTDPEFIQVSEHVLKMVREEV